MIWTLFTVYPHFLLELYWFHFCSSWKNGQFVENCCFLPNKCPSYGFNTGSMMLSTLLYDYCLLCSSCSTFPPFQFTTFGHTCTSTRNSPFGQCYAGSPTMVYMYMVVYVHVFPWCSLDPRYGMAGLSAAVVIHHKVLNIEYLWPDVWQSYGFLDESSDSSASSPGRYPFGPTEASDCWLMEKLPAKGAR